MNIVLLAFLIVKVLLLYLLASSFINLIVGGLNNMCQVFVDIECRMAKVNELLRFTLFRCQEITILVLVSIIKFKDLYFEKGLNNLLY